jgi:hypothetical protein
MKENGMIKKSLIILMPVKSEKEIDRTIDTINSIEYYIRSDHEIILLEGIEGICRNLKKLFSNITVYNGESFEGPFGSLCVDLTRVIRLILEKYEFDILLRLDNDALIIGFSPEKDAISYFEENPGVGMLGSYKKDCNGNQRDFEPVKKTLKEEVGFIKRILRPELVKTLNDLLKQATINGYELGEHCLGAAYFLSYQCLDTIKQKGLLSIDPLKYSRLGDDHIISMLVRASNYRIADFTTGDYPICVKWRGLPCSPDELISRRKKIIHSTKSYKQFREIDTRNYFKKIRQEQVDVKL